MTDIAVAPMLDTWPVISLEELQARAAFLTRKDRKYLVPLPAVEEVLSGLGDPARVLEIDGGRTFGYETPYFDDREHTAYFRALRRRPDRFKVRTRRYVESELRLLEVKLRDGRGRTVKHRIAHETEGLECLTAADRGWLHTFPQVAGHAGGLRHCLTTFYRRTTLLLPGAEGRVTIDRDLAFVLPAGGALALSGLAVVETKGAGRATSLDRLLWRARYRPLSLSKFTIGLALLVPDLPANRWHRLRERLRAVAEQPGPDTWGRGDSV